MTMCLQENDGILECVFLASLRLLHDYCLLYSGPLTAAVPSPTILRETLTF